VGTHLPDLGVPLVLDLHGSLVLENAFRRHRSLASNAAAKLKALRRADLILCPGERQRAYFTAWMLLAGADPLAPPVLVVPVCLPPEQPPRAAPAEGPLELVYGGQLWPWIDSRPGLQAAAELLARTGAGTLQLLAGAPAVSELLRHDDASALRAASLPEEVLRSPAVRFSSLLAREEMLARYARAHLALDLYAENPERSLAITTRTVEYLWCGLPVVHGDYSELAPLIERYRAGWLAPAGDARAIGRVLEEALADRAELARRSENARRLAREQLSWDRALAPLDGFLEAPSVREPGRTIFGALALEFDRLADESTQTVGELRREAAGLREELARRARGEREVLERGGAEAHREAEQVEASRREAADARREASRLEAEAGAQRARAREEAAEHARTAVRCERAEAERSRVGRELAEERQRGELLRTDLKAALERLDRLAAEGERRAEVQGGRAREASGRELALRGELAVAGAELEEARQRLARAEAGLGAAEERAAQLAARLEELLSTAPQRALATGRHLLRRAAVQVPALAGLWVRNLTTGAYLAARQRRRRGS